MEILLEYYTGYKDMNPSFESRDFKCHSHEAAVAQPGQGLSTIPPEANNKVTLYLTSKMHIV